MLEELLPPEVGGMPWVALAVGGVLLALGRRLYLLAVGSVGFLFGAWLTLRLELGGFPWLAVALVAGLLFALLALFLQRVAVGVAGFLIGLLALFSVLDALAITLEGWAWLIPVVGSLFVAALFSALFDVALVVLSSLLGSAVVVAAVGTTGVPALALFVALVTVGVALQSRSLYKQQEPSPTS